MKNTIWINYKPFNKNNKSHEVFIKYDENYTKQ